MQDEIRQMPAVAVQGSGSTDQPCGFLPCQSPYAARRLVLRCVDQAALSVAVINRGLQDVQFTPDRSAADRVLPFFVLLRAYRRQASPFTCAMVRSFQNWSRASMERARDNCQSAFPHHCSHMARSMAVRVQIDEAASSTRSLDQRNRLHAPRTHSSPDRARP